ncbi:MAG: hypothetical protein AMJ43_04095 [Coxiella sp. DG_40]|nr:MAG: hypothetical protein AMJ43_04095 [Coxiella sp. DG_40]
MLKKITSLTIFILVILISMSVYGDIEQFDSTLIDQQSVKNDGKVQTLGISRDQAMENLSEYFLMSEGKAMSNGQANYIGHTVDSIALLQLIGDKSDISEAALLLGLPNDNDSVVIKNLTLIILFIHNFFPDQQEEVLDWASDSWSKMAKISDDSDDNISQKKIFNGKDFKITFYKDMGIMLLDIKQASTS